MCLENVVQIKDSPPNNMSLNLYPPGSKTKAEVYLMEYYIFTSFECHLVVKRVVNAIELHVKLDNMHI